MLPVIFSRRASAQIAKLESYLADRFYPLRTRRYIDRLTQTCLNIADAPYQGTSREDLAPNLRTRGFEGTVTIYFKVSVEKIIIVGVYYRGQIPASLI